jgi:histidyl-tRNA synthetase
LAAAQNGVGGGGRYDGLAEALGGPPTPGIGFGTGIERIRLACEAEGVDLIGAAPLDVFVVDTTGGMHALRLTALLRDAGMRADRAWDSRSFKAQFKAADRSGARVAVVVGADEAARGVVGVKPLRGAPADGAPVGGALASGAQFEVPEALVVERVREMIDAPD